MMLLQAQAVGVGILPLLLLLLLVLLLGSVLIGVVALFRRGGAARALALGLTAFALLVVAGVAGIFVVRGTSHQESTSAFVRVHVPRHDARTSNPSGVSIQPLDQEARATIPAQGWRPAADILPDAEVDFYPSRREAERALAGAIVKAYATADHDGSVEAETAVIRNAPSPLVLTHAMGGPPTGAYQPVADAIRNLGVPCNDVRAGVRNHTHQYGIRLELTPPTESSPIGTYRAWDDRLNDQVAFASTARFLDKPWLTDLTAHRITAGAPHLLVGIGEALEILPAAAENAALRAAAAQLALRLVDERPRGRYDANILYPQLDAVVRNLRRLGLVQDHFAQQLERPYGTVHRHAVLIDATPQLITRLYDDNTLVWTDLPPQQQLSRAPATGPATASAPLPPDLPVFPAAPHAPSPPAVAVSPPAPQRAAYTSRSSILARILGLAALSALTLLLYHVLNRWTLGYRQGPLTITTIAVILGGAALLGLLTVA